MLQGNVIVVDRLDTRWISVWLFPLSPTSPGMFLNEFATDYHSYLIGSKTTLFGWIGRLPLILE
jgi:hypothetical protein